MARLPPYFIRIMLVIHTNSLQKAWFVLQGCVHTPYARHCNTFVLMYNDSWCQRTLIPVNFEKSYLSGFWQIYIFDRAGANQNCCFRHCKLDINKYTCKVYQYSSPWAYLHNVAYLCLQSSLIILLYLRVDLFQYLTILHYLNN